MCRRKAADACERSGAKHTYIHNVIERISRWWDEARSAHKELWYSMLNSRPRKCHNGVVGCPKAAIKTPTYMYATTLNWFPVRIGHFMNPKTAYPKVPRPRRFDSDRPESKNQL